MIYSLNHSVMTDPNLCPLTCDATIIFGSLKIKRVTIWRRFTTLSDANRWVKIHCDRKLNEAELHVLIGTVFGNMVSVFLVVLILTIKKDMNSWVFLLG